MCRCFLLRDFIKPINRLLKPKNRTSAPALPFPLRQVSSRQEAPKLGLAGTWIKLKSGIQRYYTFHELASALWPYYQRLPLPALQPGELAARPEGIKGNNWGSQNVVEHRARSVLAFDIPGPALCHPTELPENRSRGESLIRLVGSGPAKGELASAPILGLGLQDAGWPMQGTGAQ